MGVEIQVNNLTKRFGSQTIWEDVSLTLPASTLGPLSSLRGARVYVTTWDYDAGYRALGAAVQPFAVGGGAPGQPKVMDASAVITLP